VAGLQFRIVIVVYYLGTYIADPRVVVVHYFFTTSFTSTEKRVVAGLSYNIPEAVCLYMKNDKVYAMNSKPAE
jgi:Na+/serine symporter